MVISADDGIAAGAATACAFENEAQRVLGRLRRAVAVVVDAAAGNGNPPTRPVRAADLRRTLDLDVALAWQVHTIATSDDVLRAGRVVPKAGAMERFLESARARGMPEAMTREVEEAYGEFERLIGEHAGDRETLDAMLSALRPDQSALRRIRRAAFKANAAVWGVMVRCTLNCVIFHQRPTGEHDCLSVRGRMGVRRLQEGAVIGIYASGRTWGGSTCPPEGAEGVSIDTCGLIEEACSTPVPRVEHVTAPDGSVRDYLRLEGLGRSSEISVAWRNLALNFPGGSTNPPHGCSVPILEPAETAVMDLLVPKGWTDPSTARVWVTLAMGPHGAVAAEGPGVQQLPFECGVEHLGTRLDSMFTRHEPRWSEIIASQLAQLGWNEEFDIYRCVAAYPVLHSAVHLCVG